jgi:hypothetical protein
MQGSQLGVERANKIQGRWPRSGLHCRSRVPASKESEGVGEAMAITGVHSRNPGGIMEQP